MRRALHLLLLVCAALLPSCSWERAGESEATGRIAIPDDTGDTLYLRRTARRIVSLVPATTEILFALGEGDRVVGRTRYGTHPSAARSVPTVGGGIRPDPERIVAREPDLVILFAGSANRESLDKLRSLGLNVLAIEHNDLKDLRRNIARLGEVTGATAAADSLYERLSTGLDAVAARSARRDRVAVYYHLPGNPPFTVGAGSYIDTLLHIAGGRNVFGDLDRPSAPVSLEAVVARQPDCVLLGAGGSAESALERLRESEGWNAVDAVAVGRIAVVDAELVHRLGPRIDEAARALARALGRCVAGTGGAP